MYAFVWRPASIWDNAAYWQTISLFYICWTASLCVVSLEEVLTDMWDIGTKLFQCRLVVTMTQTSSGLFTRLAQAPPARHDRGTTEGDPPGGSASVALMVRRLHGPGDHCHEACMIEIVLVAYLQGWCSVSLRNHRLCHLPAEESSPGQWKSCFRFHS